MANTDRKNDEEEVGLQGEEGDGVAGDEDDAAHEDGQPGTQTLRYHAPKNCENPLGHPLACREEDEVLVLHVRVVPVLPHVGGDVGVEVGIAVIEGEADVKEESTDHNENARFVCLGKSEGLSCCQHHQSSVSKKFLRTGRISTMKPDSDTGQILYKSGSITCLRVFAKALARPQGKKKVLNIPAVDQVWGLSIHPSITKVFQRDKVLQHDERAGRICRPLLRAEVWCSL